MKSSLQWLYPGFTLKRTWVLGPTHVNKDSLNASVVLGINGITIIAETGEGDADNDGRINLKTRILKLITCVIFSPVQSLGHGPRPLWILKNSL